jgi:hypothetical protein
MLNSTASVLAGELVPTRRDVACAPEILGSIKESAAARNAQPWQVDGEKRFVEKKFLAAVTTLARLLKHSIGVLRPGSGRTDA